MIKKMSLRTKMDMIEKIETLTKINSDLRKQYLDNEIKINCFRNKLDSDNTKIKYK
jgi:hypothetical protein